MSEVRFLTSISPNVQRYIAGSTITLGLSIYVDDVLTNESTLTFKWKMGRDGDESSVTPTHGTTGVYSVALTPLTGGDLYYRWDTEGTLDAAQEGRLSVKESAFTL